MPAGPIVFQAPVHCTYVRVQELLDLGKDGCSSIPALDGAEGPWVPQNVCHATSKKERRPVGARMGQAALMENVDAIQLPRQSAVQHLPLQEAGALRQHEENLAELAALRLVRTVTA